jgi:SynChlorMet cassette protein ScmD
VRNFPARKNPLLFANPVVVLREEFDDWAVLFNPDTADAFGVNPVGVAVWKSIDGTRCLDQILDVIGSQFSEVPETASDDVIRFLHELTRRGFAGYETKGPA